jgi:hypothetical protein
VRTVAIAIERVSTKLQVVDRARFLTALTRDVRSPRLGPRTRQVWLAAGLVALTGWPAHVCAQLRAASRVVLVSPGRELEHAARAALEPWNIEIRVVSAPSPGAVAPVANESARELAISQAAAAIVWVSQHEQAHAVWVYDLATDQAVSRPLQGAPPFDAAAAAAAALSIKTLLRHSAAAPETERYGAGETAQRPELVATPPPIGAEAIEAAAAENGEPAPQPSAAASNLDLDVLASLRFGFARRQSTLEPRAGLGVHVWPGARRLGLALRTAFGTGLAVDAVSFRGRLLALELLLAGELRYPASRTLQLSAAGGPSLHLTFLNGTLNRDGAASATRAVPALALELAGSWFASRSFRAGIRAAASWLLRPQRYLVRGEPVFELSRTAFELGVTGAWTLAE